MKNALKIIFSLGLTTIFLFTCVIVLSFLFFASWLHTYRVFTQQRPVAQLEISEQKFDDLGPYVDVTLNQVDAASPISNILMSEEERNIQSEVEITEYKLYGDVVYLGGPIVKFEDILTLLNFQTAYKIGQIEAEYSVQIDLEENRSENMFSKYQLNGGLDGWRNIVSAIQNDTLEGKFYDFFIDSVPQIDKQGVFVLDEPQTRTFCVTEEGFFFCDEELIF